MGLTGWWRRRRRRRAAGDPGEPDGRSSAPEYAERARHADGDAGKAGDAPSVIEIFDGLGRKVVIPREEWRRKVLPGELERHRDDADGLYSALVMALQDGFAEDLDGASRRLMEIDPDRERSHTVRGIVLLETGRLDEAEKVLRAYLDESKPSGAVLTNLAKVQLRRGDAAASERTLREALEADPNLQNGLEWWLALAHEREGRAARIRAAEEIAALPGSWRPQLYLAREHLEDGDLEEALERYREAFVVAPDQADVLLMVSGDLGSTGHLAEAVDLVLPRYDPALHGPQVGFNLLQALHELGGPRRGLAVVEAVAKLKLPPELRERLGQYEAAFEAMAEEPPEVVATREGQVVVGLTLLEFPVWYPGLEDPDWLPVRKPEAAPRIAFVAWSVDRGTGEPATGVEAQREEPLGRLSRSGPLFLAERALFASSASPVVVLPLLEKAGPVVTSQEWTGDGVTSLFDKLGEAAPDLLVTGILDSASERLGLRLTIWRRGSDRAAGSIEVDGDPEDRGELLGALDEELSSRLGSLGITVSNAGGHWARLPEPNLLGPYLDGLAQSLSLLFAHRGMMPRDALRGERRMLDWFLRLSLQLPELPQPPLLFLSGLIRSHGIGSQVSQEFEEPALALLNEADPGSPYARLAPLLFRLFNREEELEKAQGRAASLPEGDPYRGWVERVAAGAGG